MVPGGSRKQPASWNGGPFHSSLLPCHNSVLSLDKEPLFFFSYPLLPAAVLKALYKRLDLPSITESHLGKCSQLAAVGCTLTSQGFSRRALFSLQLLRYIQQRVGVLSLTKSFLIYPFLLSKFKPS